LMACGALLKQSKKKPSGKRENAERQIMELVENKLAIEKLDHWTVGVGVYGRGICIVVRGKDLRGEQFVSLSF